MLWLYPGGPHSTPAQWKMIQQVYTAHPCSTSTSYDIYIYILQLCILLIRRVGQIRTYAVFMAGKSPIYDHIRCTRFWPTLSVQHIRTMALPRKPTQKEMQHIFTAHLYSSCFSHNCRLQALEHKKKDVPAWPGQNHKHQHTVFPTLLPTRTQIDVTRDAAKFQFQGTPSQATASV